MQEAAGHIGSTVKRQRLVGASTCSDGFLLLFVFRSLLHVDRLTLRVGLFSSTKSLKTPSRPCLQVYDYKSSQVDNENYHISLMARKPLAPMNLPREMLYGVSHRKQEKQEPRAPKNLSHPQ